MSKKAAHEASSNKSENLTTGSLQARRVAVEGVVQGVGFRPFVYRLAKRHGLKGWVTNREFGVEIHVEGSQSDIEAFLRELEAQAPPAARISRVEAGKTAPGNAGEFAIAKSEKADPPTTRISPDLPVCRDCLKELFDPLDRRFRYPYINCTHCGPRYSILLGLPYDRDRTTMRDWSLCEHCRVEYEDPLDRRFHAQPVACPTCGPGYVLRGWRRRARAESQQVIEEAARMLSAGKILAIKGLGGYHLACDALRPRAVAALRKRKFRKEKPFALMARDMQTARRLVKLTPEAEELLTSVARPIVLAQAKAKLAGVSPENQDLGVMLPYAPVHHLLFDAGAPTVLVMTSANHSSEPIAFRDEDAFVRLNGICDDFLVGERPIARRVEDSVIRHTCLGPMVLRRARGYSPGAVARLPCSRPILAVGADLKNSVTLSVDGQAVVSQHLGDLSQLDVLQACEETIRDLMNMYEVSPEGTLVVCDLHPEYASTCLAQSLPGRKMYVQHHRAHIASVIAERSAWETPVIGLSFDGAGFGDDGSIWGGEVFVGSLAEGLARVAHLRRATLVGGDAAARFPVQAAAGFLVELDGLPDLLPPPFSFPEKFPQLLDLARGRFRSFPTTSIGRLFDTAAALLGFTRRISFEGQAASWLEQLGRSGKQVRRYPFPAFDYRPLLQAILQDRAKGVELAAIARSFHAALARALVEQCLQLQEEVDIRTVVLSGGVFQNELLLSEIAGQFGRVPRKKRMELWINRHTPPNDGGISLGQAAMAAVAEHWHGGHAGHQPSAGGPARPC